jgi:hypothetical protein
VSNRISTAFHMELGGGLRMNARVAGNTDAHRQAELLAQVLRAIGAPGTSIPPTLCPQIVVGGPRKRT